MVSPMKLLEVFRLTHKSRVNRLLHYLSVLLFVVGLAYLYWNWFLGLGIFITGVLCMVAGHFYEGKPPAFVQLNRDKE